MSRDLRPQGLYHRHARSWAPLPAPRRILNAGLDMAVLVAFFGIGLMVVACIYG